MSRQAARVEEIEDDNRFTTVEDEFDDDMDFELPDLPTPPPVPMPLQHDSRIPSRDVNYVQDTAQFKGWTSLYPIYFDASRTTKHGRRVGRQHAVQNPLAKTIADACKLIGFSIVFEPQKSHPADWSNPGRVRIEFWDDNHRPTHRTIHTKSALLAAVCKYLKIHPTTLADPAKVPVPGISVESKRAAIPKGMKINDIVPLHSPAMGGGGVNSDQLQNMMGGMFPGMASVMGNDQDNSGQGSSTVPPAASVPKKPKMKRQIIR